MQRQPQDHYASIAVLHHHRYGFQALAEAVEREEPFQWLRHPLPRDRPSLRIGISPVFSLLQPPLGCPDSKILTPLTCSYASESCSWALRFAPQTLSLWKLSFKKWIFEMGFADPFFLCLCNSFSGLKCQNRMRFEMGLSGTYIYLFIYFSGLILNSWGGFCWFPSEKLKEGRMNLGFFLWNLIFLD